MKIFTVICLHLAAYLKLQISVRVGGETALHGLRPVQYRGMAPSLLILSNGEGCFSLKLKIRAAMSREYPPSSLASSDGTWNTPVHAGTQLMPVCSVTQSLTLSVFANLLIYIIFILKSLNRPIPGCHRAWFQYLLPLGRKLAGNPSCVGVRSLLFWIILQDSTKTYTNTTYTKQIYDVQEVVLDSSTGQRTER